MLFKHLATRGAERITPTVRQVRYWFGVISRECFEGKLPNPDAVLFQDLPAGVLAMVDLDYGFDEDSYDLILCPREYLRHEFLALLAHEAAHVAVWYLDEDHRSMHGPRFMSYGPALAKVGLPLHPFYHGPTA